MNWLLFMEAMIYKDVYLSIAFPQLGERQFISVAGAFLVANFEEYIASAFRFIAAEGGSMFGDQVVCHALSILRLLKREEAFSSIKEIGYRLTALQALHFPIEGERLAILVFLK